MLIQALLVVYLHQLVHKRLATQCLGLLIDVEEQSFEKRLDTFIPLLSSCLVTSDGEEDGGSVGSEDHLLFNTLSTLRKVFTTCMVTMETNDHTPIIFGTICLSHIIVKDT